MAIVGIAGMSGSGKSTIIEDYGRRGFVILDDLGRNPNWKANAEQVKALAAAGRDIVVSDLLFCCETAEEAREINDTFPGRTAFEAWVGQKLDWIYFANDPWSCALNCLWRRMYEKPERSLDFEIGLIERITRFYRPPSDAHPVYRRG